MRTTTTVFSALLAAAALAVACKGDDSGDPGDASDQPDVVREPFGAPCTTDDGCESGACFEGTCTRPCSYLTDCPEEGYTCAQVDGGRILCATTRYVSGPGTNGESCVVDPCDEAQGFRCHRRGDSDPDAYCTHDCTDDRDCPYRMACRDSDDGRHCHPRSYCEPCIADDQCGYASDHCMEDDAGDEFCSMLCDPERATTCPQDSSCVEARPGEFQCKPDFGRCVGDGGYCEPCRDGTDCAADSTCITDTYTKFSFCGSPCAETSDCPDESYCTSDFDQCRPRKGSCQTRSGGKHTCERCGDFTDCFSGWCLDLFPRPSGDGEADTCADPCDPDDPDSCGPWAGCYRLTDSTGATAGYACIVNESMQCWHYTTCMADCPDGPSGCSHSYCR